MKPVTKVLPNLSASAGAGGQGDFHFGVLKVCRFLVRSNEAEVDLPSEAPTGQSRGHTDKPRGRRPLRYSRGHDGRIAVLRSVRRRHQEGNQHRRWAHTAHHLINTLQSPLYSPSLLRYQEEVTAYLQVYVSSGEREEEGQQPGEVGGTDACKYCHVKRRDYEMHCNENAPVTGSHPLALFVRRSNKCGTTIKHAEIRTR